MIALKLGVKLAFIYDIIRMFRFLVLHNNFFISLEDFLFWIYSSVIMFKVQLEQSNGVLRGFSVLAMFMGMLLYNRLIGERLTKMEEKGITFAKRQLTERIKMFKMNLHKHCAVFRKSRSNYDRKKNSGKKEETE